MRDRTMFAVIVAVAVLAGCGGAEDETDRDLTLASADSVAALGDTAPGAAPQAQPSQPAPATPAQPRPRPSPPVLETGTAVLAYAADTLTSRHNKVGDTVVAVILDPVADARGREVIPSGAVLYGMISDIAPAESPGGQGRMTLAFNRVQIDGMSYPVAVQVDSLGTHMKGRGITAGDAAKVGAGAVVGAVAGRIIGGNRTGTIVGAAAGAAAGAGIAAATRDIDIMLDAGAPIFMVLTARFTR